MIKGRDPFRDQGPLIAGSDNGGVAVTGRFMILIRFYPIPAARGQWGRSHCIIPPTRFHHPERRPYLTESDSREIEPWPFVS